MSQKHDSETFWHPGEEHGGKLYVRLRESDELLTNPGMGFCTAQRFNGDPTEKENRWNDDGPTEYLPFRGSLHNEDFPDTSVAYLRWYWARLEPQRGEYRWDVIDRALAEAGKRGQQLHIRVMPHDKTGIVPQWYKRQGRVIEFTLDDGRRSCVPDYFDPLFRESTRRLVGQLGERYDGHPLLCAVDIGTLGHWGEWHIGDIPGASMGDEALRRWAIDLYFDAFPRTPKLMLIAPEDGMAYATGRGAGWRADCWGDVRDGWGHMYDYYPGTVYRSGATDAWKRGPVCLETCWTFLHWFRRGWDVRYMLDEALRWHASLINAKSSIIPRQWQDQVAAFQKQLGYRFVLRSIACPARIRRGQPFRLEHWWVNRGVAPCYADFRILVRLAGEKRNLDFELSHDLKAWLPGDDQCPRDQLTLPPDAPAGRYALQIGIVRPGQTTPAVKTANEGRDESGWLAAGEVTVG
jgi:hypothetical protein